MSDSVRDHVRPSLRRRQLLLAGIGSAACVSSLAQADSFPSRPIRLVVPWPTGGSSDVTARLFTDKLGAELKTPFGVDNRGGASGRIGIREGLQRAPDGYTMILINTSTNVALPVVDAALDFDPARSFTLLAPIAIDTLGAGRQPRRADRPCEAEPRQADLCQPGRRQDAPPEHRAVRRAGRHPDAARARKGRCADTRGPAGGRVDLFITDFGVMEDVKAGKLKAFATTAPVRVPFHPDLPTAAELGLPGLDLVA